MSALWELLRSEGASQEALEMAADLAERNRALVALVRKLHAAQCNGNSDQCDVCQDVVAYSS